MNIAEIRFPLFFLFISFCFPAFSQTYSFDHYSVKEGLSQSDVKGVVQDRKGYLWIGTGSGLSRFDGKNFQNYSVEDGLADDKITSMMMDRDGNIWLGHSNGNITVYNGNTFTILNTPGMIAGKEIYSIFQDREKRIWISVAPYGVLLLPGLRSASDTAAYKSYRSKDGLSEYVISVFQLRDGRLGFITDIGIKILQPGTGRFEFLKVQGMPPAQILCFKQDEEGNYWIGTYNRGLVFYDVKANRSRVYNTANGFPFDLVTALMETPQGKIWAATWGGGAAEINPHSGEIKIFNTTSGLQSNKIGSLFQDREGNIILGTFGKGIAVYKGEKFISYTKENGLLSELVNAITRDNSGNIWFGTTAGLSLYNPEKGSIRNITSANGVSLEGITALKKDASGDIWIGLWGNGIIRYDAGSSVFVKVPSLSLLLSPYVSSIETGRKGALWFGTIEGAVRYNPVSGETKTFRTLDGLIGNDIQSVFCDSKGRIWFTCPGRGLSVYDGTRFRNFSRKEGYTHSAPLALCEDIQGNIWIGAEGGGIFIYDGKQFSHMGKKDGLASDFITLMVSDGRDNIFIGTNRGLSKYNIPEKKIYNYGRYDGFAAIETRRRAAYRDDKGLLWFGTARGATVYNAAYDAKNTMEPVLSLSSVKVNNKEITPVPGTELGYEENSLSFEFMAVWISNAEQVKYRFWLEGFDENWRPLTADNTVDYSNLSPGKYTLKAVAENGFGIQTKEPLQFSFSIRPPFWQTWWFFASCTFVVVTGFFSYVKIRERNLVREKRILENKVHERTAEVVQKNTELDEKNRDITASIRYAKRIQDAILPPDEFVKKTLPKTFILFKPKDIVSGDFYWAARKDNKVLFAAVDCTGHGVPGAFMSIVGYNILEQVVKQHGETQPAAILDALNKSVSDTLRQSYTEDNPVKDGMDISLCCFNYDNHEMQWAGAFNPLYLVRDKELTEIKADKSPIGNLKIGEQKKFTNHSIPLQEGDTLYIFSDGYADQFGGPMGKKLKYGTFKRMLVEINGMNMDEQKQWLDKKLEEWKGDLDQVDDVLIIGTQL